jgi:tRNA(Ile)-lysidine synthase
MRTPFAAAPAVAEPPFPVEPIAAGAAAAFDRRLDPVSSAPVAVALSGGGDSLALLLLAADWCAAHRRPLLALTVDHGLNPASGGWTALAGEAAGRAGAAWRALRWEGPKPSAGLPAAARVARHRLLAQAAREAGAGVLLTGHTRDDVLEGELMRAGDVPGLGRLREWSPSPVWPDGRDLFLLRPLLGAGRADLRAWLRARGEVWLDDPANEDLRSARARARREISGSVLLPSTVEKAAAVPAGGEVLADGRIVLSRQDLSGRLLSAALLCAAGTDRPPRGEPLARLQGRLQAGGPVQATLAGARLVSGEATVQIGRDAGERLRGGLAPVALAQNIPTIWDGRFELTAAEPGWTAAALGGLMARLPAPERHRLKLIPAWARGALPALVGAAGEVRLPAPFGEGPAQAVSLAGPRFAAACGLAARESEIASPRHGADGLVTLCSGPVG